jgi:hypothetical protein
VFEFGLGATAQWHLDAEPRKKTRGLNRNHNRHLKSVFKGAATTVICEKSGNDFGKAYVRLLESGTKPGQTNHRTKNCVNGLGHVEEKRGVRGEGRQSIAG